MPIAYAASGSGTLDSVAVWIDGVQGLAVAPNSTYDVTNELASGLHVLQGNFIYGNCKLAGVYTRYVQMNENATTPVFGYAATC